MLNYIPTPTSPPIDLNQMAKWLKVLAEPNRLLIFHFLMEGVQCNCELGDGPANGSEPDFPPPARAA